MRREVLGADLVQGKDYVLTIAGQIKGIGHPSLDPQKDPGLDGATSGSNTHVAKDALGMAFGYYGGDFSRSYSGNQSPYNASESTLLAPGSDLFSGFIGSYALKQQTMTVPPGQTLLKNGDLVGERFVYDRIGRIRSGTTQKRNGSTWEAETTSGYSGTYVYDQNGTMRRFTRRAMTDPTTSVLLDDVTITMNTTTSNVVDVVSEAATGIAGYNADVKNQTTGQTSTDAKGQQTQNIGMNEARTTEWRSDGDVKRVTTPSTVLTHAYDAFGRIVRTRSSTEDKTWYRIHGTSMDEALYTRSGSNTPSIQEWTLYGIGRVGVDRTTASVSSGDLHYRIIGSKLYEMTDHLGTVRGLVTDIKIPDGSGRFNAEEVEVRDYDPYGQERPNRAVTALTNLYGYAWHGMRKQIEGGWVNDYGTLFRPYEGGLGRWSSQDPIMRSWATPYEGMGSSPTMLIDPLGLEPSGGGGYADRPSSVEMGGGGGSGTTSSGVAQTMTTTGSSQAADAKAPQMAPTAPKELDFWLTLKAIRIAVEKGVVNVGFINTRRLPKIDNSKDEYGPAIANGAINVVNGAPEAASVGLGIFGSIDNGTIVADTKKKWEDAKDWGGKQWDYLTTTPVEKQFENSWNFWTSPRGVETGTTIVLGMTIPAGASKIGAVERAGAAGSEALGAEGAISGTRSGAVGAAEHTAPSVTKVESAAETAGMPAKQGPKSSPKFQAPTNSPQLPPATIPEGLILRVMKPTQQYPNGYWVLEKPMKQGGFQKINPATMRSGREWDTHVPLPKSYWDNH